MKYILLLFSFFIFFIAQTVDAQSHEGDCNDDKRNEAQLVNNNEDENQYADEEYVVRSRTTASKPQIYPNPAIHYFEVTGEEVNTITIYNIVGRKMKTFVAQENKKYSIEDLPMGMYLVQIFGQDNKILSTSRLSKRLP